LEVDLIIDTVGWATGTASGLQKTGCQAVDGDDMIGALHVFIAPVVTHIYNVFQKTAHTPFYLLE